MKKLLEMLQAYEKRHSPLTWPDGSVRFPHWYKLTLYSDGSGSVEDSVGDKKIFDFTSLESLENRIKE